MSELDCTMFFPVFPITACLLQSDPCFEFITFIDWIDAGAELRVFLALKELENAKKKRGGEDGEVRPLGQEKYKLEFFVVHFPQLRADPL